MNDKKNKTMALICKKEFEEALEEEIRLRAGSDAPSISATQSGLLILRADFHHPLQEPELPNDSSEVANPEKVDGDTPSLPSDLHAGRARMLRAANQSTAHFLEKPFIFERQRIENAMLIPNDSLKRMAREVVKQLLPTITTSEAAWTCHVFALDSAENENNDQEKADITTEFTETRSDASSSSSPCLRGEDSSMERKTLSARARNFERVLLEFCGERFARVLRRYKPPAEIEREKRGLVLNLCLVPEGIWGGVMPCERLSDPRPGGIHRMAFDRHAPCRSYLKIEEALHLMGEKPVRGQTVVDLGASPGGWSYAFLKRGCHVVAVDNGPLLIERLEQYGDSLTHLRQDGVIFEPDRQNLPVDWLVSDMLISTGKNIGMLRKWFSNRWMRQFVVNIKLPQLHPYAALKPVEDFLGSTRDIAFDIRQLYHDRREVTLFGRMT
jgi:23S rRNA C2498 (ribose-2'-O)-methylase RlmM